MAETLNYYRILNVNRGCSREELRRAYRQQVLANHPDLHPTRADATRRLQEINEAYDTLSDPVKRAAYDRQLARSERPAYANKPPGPEPTRGSRHGRPYPADQPDPDLWDDDEYYLQYLPRDRHGSVVDGLGERLDDELFQLRRLLRRWLR
ncbi:MAG: J domain-containing protein [Chloroflexota bacterium]